MPGPLSATLNDDALRRRVHARVPAPAARRNVLQGVLEQVGDELRQQLAIAGERRRVGASSDTSSRRRACPGAYNSTMLVASPGEIHFVAVRGQPLRFGACDLQQRAQRALHAVEFLERRADQFLGFASMARHRPALRNCASSRRTRNRYSGVRRS